MSLPADVPVWGLHNVEEHFDSHRARDQNARPQELALQLARDRNVALAAAHPGASRAELAMAGVHVFAYPLFTAKNDGSTYNKYIVMTYWRAFQMLLDLPMHQRALLELIAEGTPCHAYADIDCYPELEADRPAHAEGLVELFRATFPTFMQDATGHAAARIIELDSSTPQKLSRHFVIPMADGAMFETNAHVGALMRRYVHHLEVERGMGEQVRVRMPNTRLTASFTDLGVFTRNRVFRMAYCTKPRRDTATQRYLYPLGQGLDAPLDWDTFRACLVCAPGPDGPIVRTTEVDGSDPVSTSVGTWDVASAGVGRRTTAGLPRTPMERAASGGQSTIRAIADALAECLEECGLPGCYYVQHSAVEGLVIMHTNHGVCPLRMQDAGLAYGRDRDLPAHRHNGAVLTCRLAPFSVRHKCHSYVCKTRIDDSRGALRWPQVPLKPSRRLTDAIAKHFAETWTAETRCAPALTQVVLPSGSTVDVALRDL